MAGRSDFDQIGSDMDREKKDRSTDRDPARSISFFKILFGSILVKIWAFKKGQIHISLKMPLQKLYENLIFEFLFYFFFKKST